MLTIKNLNKKYQDEYVLKDINLSMQTKYSLALVGESGAGKSTLSKLILGLEKPSSGKINLEKKSLSVVFQEYRSSVNPSFKIKQILEEPFWISKKKFELKEIEKLFTKFELPISLLNKYSHELSGGQLQRVCIIRALLSNPSFLILDEAFSAIDASTKTKIVKVLKNLKEEQVISYLLISHDLQIATALCDEIKILYKGEIIESLETKSLKNAKEEYTKMLINSVVTLDD